MTYLEGCLPFSSESEESSSDEEDDDEGHHEDLETDFRKLEMERGERGQGRAGLHTGRHLSTWRNLCSKVRESRSVFELDYSGLV